MTLEAFEACCLALPGATVSIQWGDDHVYKVGGKMFAVAGAPGGSAFCSFSFKASEMAFQLLPEIGAAKPAPYMARAQWVQTLGPDSIADEDLRAHIVQAHALVAAKLTRAARKAIGLE